LSLIFAVVIAIEIDIAIAIDICNFVAQII